MAASGYLDAKATHVQSASDLTTASRRGSEKTPNGKVFEPPDSLGCAQGASLREPAGCWPGSSSPKNPAGDWQP
jgi:hypothetical protein